MACLGLHIELGAGLLLLVVFPSSALEFLCPCDHLVSGSSAVACLAVLMRMMLLRAGGAIASTICSLSFFLAILERCCPILPIVRRGRRGFRSPQRRLCFPRRRPNNLYLACWDFVLWRCGLCLGHRFFHLLLLPPGSFQGVRLSFLFVSVASVVAFAASSFASLASCFVAIISLSSFEKPASFWAIGFCRVAIMSSRSNFLGGVFGTVVPGS